MKIAAPELFRVTDEHLGLEFDYIAKEVGLATLAAFVDLMCPLQESFALMSVEEKMLHVDEIVQRDLEDPENEEKRLTDVHQNALGQFMQRTRTLFDVIKGYGLGIILAGSIEVVNFVPISDFPEDKPNNIYGTTHRLNALVVGNNVEVTKTTHSILPGGITSGWPHEMPLVTDDEEIIVGAIARLDETNQVLKAEL